MHIFMQNNSIHSEELLIMNTNRPTRKEIFELMAAGCLLGILCFGMVYGFKILDFTYDAWLFHGDMDLQQHYIGFCHFRNTPWHFPVGLVDSLSAPYSMSIVYTDSIPLFAVIFKIFSAVLPVHFQYFGLFGILSFALMGMLSTVLIRRFTERKAVCIAGSLFFILSFPVLQRMFYHTALSAQWIIVLALIVWFYNDITDKKQTKKLCIYWGLIGLLAVSIHSYFVFMTGIVLLAAVIEGIIRCRKDTKSDMKVDNKTVKKRIFAIVLPLISMGISSFILLFILGGFYGSGSVSGDGFGSFNGNLSSYINPLGYGRIFGGFGLNGMFEFEGFGYLGAGILLLLASAIAAAVIKSKGETGDSLNIFRRLTLRKKVIIATTVFTLIFACFPNYSFGTIKILGIPVPSVIQKVFGICRTNGRFVWVGMYLIMICAVYFAAKNYDRLFVRIIFAAAVIIQIYDVSATVKQYQSKYERDMAYTSEWEEIEASGILENKTQFVFMYNDSEMMMDTAYYAYLHDMNQNSFYYARTIYDEIDENIAYWKDCIEKGEVREDTVYVFRDEDFTDDYEEAVSLANATKTDMDGLVVITR